MRKNLVQKKKLIDAQLRKNPCVQAAAVEVLVANLKYPDHGDEWGDEAGQVYGRCCSLMGLPPEGQKLTPKQEALDEAVLETIHGLSTKMEAALIKARLLRPDCAMVWEREKEIQEVRIARRSFQSQKVA